MAFFEILCPVDFSEHSQRAMRFAALFARPFGSQITVLIVMGTHGRRGLRRLTLGSDAELVVRSAPVPVLLVRGSAKDSPK